MEGTLKRRKKHRRVCDHCDQLLGKLTMKCPRCERVVLTLLPKVVITILGFLALLALLRELDLISIV